MTDDESKPMTRTELAMLWDLLGEWVARNGPDAYVGTIRGHIDDELTERFGG